MAHSQTSQLQASWIQMTPGVCGGDACIRETRIPVWSVVQARKLGAGAGELLDYFVTPLTAADLEAAWAYYQDHPEEIDGAIRENDEA